MITSILDSVKKNLGVDPSDTAFDDELLLDINSVFADLNQIGIGPDAGFEIEDKQADWASYLGSVPLLNNVKTYVFLKVKLLFDPPATGFAVAAMEKQIEQLEWRINVYHEGTIS